MAETLTTIKNRPYGPKKALGTVVARQGFMDSDAEFGPQIIGFEILSAS